MTREELARQIAEVAMLRGTFTLRSGRTSDYYLDKYLFSTQPHILRELGSMFAARLPEDTTKLAGAELGGIPLVTATSLAHPSARFFITRLASGNLLLVKHGNIDQKTGRSHLTAFVSEDDGNSWQGGLLLDQRSGVSYPDGQQADDAAIRIIYDYSRTGARQILMASFAEADVAAGQRVTPQVRLRQIVSDASAAEKQPESAAK
jgi:hypothetical protein